MEPDHVAKRETRTGSWLPALLYSLNVVLWIVTALAARASGRLWLVILPLIALALYLVRTSGRS